MTLHQEYRLVGILNFHVDDLMLAGDESDPLYLSALETTRGLYGWSSWAQTHSKCVAAMFNNKT